MYPFARQEMMLKDLFDDAKKSKKSKKVKKAKNVQGSMYNFSAPELFSMAYGPYHSSYLHVGDGRPSSLFTWYGEELDWADSLDNYKELQSFGRKWCDMLSNDYPCVDPISWRGMLFATVTHALCYEEFHDNNPDFGRLFALPKSKDVKEDGSLTDVGRFAGQDLSTPLLCATTDMNFVKAAASKSGRYRKGGKDGFEAEARPSTIRRDKEIDRLTNMHVNPNLMMNEKTGILCQILGSKFMDNEDCAKALLATGRTILVNHDTNTVMYELMWTRADLRRWEPTGRDDCIRADSDEDDDRHIDWW